MASAAQKQSKNRKWGGAIHPQQPLQWCTASVTAPPPSQLHLLKVLQSSQAAPPAVAKLSLWGTFHIQTTVMNVMKSTHYEYFNKQIVYE